MRFTRTIGAAVLGAGLAVTAVPAQADTGEGCVGFPSQPATYVCVVELAPDNATPTVAAGTSVPVTVPSFCYLLDCTGDRTVLVPTYTVTPKNAPVLVVTHNGKTYTVTGTGGVGGTEDLTALVTSLAGTAVAALQNLLDHPAVQDPGSYVQGRLCAVRGFRDLFPESC